VANGPVDISVCVCGPGFVCGQCLAVCVACSMSCAVVDPLTTLASAAIFSAPPPTSTVVGATESQTKPEAVDTSVFPVLLLCVFPILTSVVPLSLCYMSLWS